MFVAGLAAGEFVVPAEGPVPFRRDKLPVDADTMASLSKQLAILAARNERADPVSARTAAQMLALSLALNPANEQALKLVGRLADGIDVEVPADKMSRAAGNRAWNLLAWLMQPEAGADANALASCLVDVMVAADPEHPKAEPWKDKGEQGAWKFWVASVDAFRASQKPEMVPQPPTGGDPDQGTSASTLATIELESSSIMIPLWHFDKEEGKSVLRQVAIKMEARLDEKTADGGKEKKPKEQDKAMNGPLIRLPGEKREKANLAISERLVPFLEGRYGSLPKGLHLLVTLPEEIHYSFIQNGAIIGSAVTVLADSIFSGSRPAASVLAVVAEDGSLALPPRFWQTLRALAAQDSGMRLILPMLAAELLPPLVTLGKSEFFITHEVLLAEDIEQLCKLASSQPPERIIQTSEGFAQIQVARGTRSLGGFLNFPSTQQRLNQIVTTVPEHASARMLALRGTSKWPQRLPRDIYAREIRAAMLPLTIEMEKDKDQLKAKTLNQAAKDCLEQISVVDRLEESVADRQQLQNPAYNTAKLMSNLADDIKRYTLKKGSDENKIASALSKLAASYKQTYRSYVATIKLLTEAAGDADVYPVPSLE